MHKLHIQMLHFNLYQRQRDHLERKMFASETFVFNIERSLGCLTNTATLTLNSLKLNNSIFLKSLVDIWLSFESLRPSEITSLH